ATAPLALVGAFHGTAIATKAVAYQLQRDTDCMDDQAALNQINEIWAMQNDIDNRVGDGHGRRGPGTGWYRVVRSPQEARAVIAAGKLAVVIGMEVDNPFDCSLGKANCTLDYVRTRLQQYYDLGVRHFFPIHFYDNAFGGSANSNFLITNTIFPNKLNP